MSEIDMSRLLSDLQRLAKQAQAQTSDQSNAANAALQQNQHQSFSHLLQNAIDTVNDAQMHSAKLKKAFEVGDPNVDLPEVMVASQKASVAFSAMLEVRKELIKAYQEVMNMPV
ncbi:MAG: flagellar hook-basal body complex protein FliE [Gammaproteobacteria bacterium]|nr:flagellar hook-basal body complex protein FliE [Gammaproteobacteria bacterium]MDH5728331.1 flagellar hook-basal body complex protein FliE [Gammaproteobacteria bacterium]